MIMYEENANIAPVKANPDMIYDFYEKFKPWEGAFKGNAFRVKCVYASTIIKTYEDKNGEKFTREDLKCAFIFNHNNETYYIEDRFYGSKIYLDGRQTGNSRRLNEFLELAHRQNPQCLDNAFEYSTDYQSGSVIPGLCGLMFIMAVATTGERTYNGRIYLNNRFYWFATDKRAAYEIKENIPVTDCVAFKAACAELKDAGQAYMQSLQENEQTEQTANNDVFQNVEQSASTASVKHEEANDDIPF